MRQPEAVDHGARQVTVRRYETTGASDSRDAVVIEEPLQIRLAWDGDERDIAVTMRTPGHDCELALGFLFTEGMLAARHAVTARHTPVQVDLAANEVCVILTELPEEAALAPRNFFVSSSCGICGKASASAVRTRLAFAGADALFSVSAAALIGLSDALLQQQTLFADTGSIHAAACFDDQGRVLEVYEDVGRHNAVDKLIGAAFINGQLPLTAAGIFVSGRAGFELVQKAAMAGCPMLAAVGAPSSLAVELAWETGLTLVGFLRDGRFNIYSCPDRVSGLS